MSYPSRGREMPEADWTSDQADERSDDSGIQDPSEDADDTDYRQAVLNSIQSQQVSFEEELRQALEESIRDNETRQSAHTEELRRAVEESRRDHDRRQRAHVKELMQAVEESAQDDEIRQRAHVHELRQAAEESRRDNEARKRAREDELRHTLEQSRRDHNIRQKAHMEERRQAVDESIRDNEARHRAHTEEQEQLVQQLGASSQKCPICLEAMEYPRTTRCQHSFCYVCLQHWLANTDGCPICRRKCLKQEVLGSD